jgi:hypothetical protein
MTYLQSYDRTITTNTSEFQAPQQSIADDGHTIIPSTQIINQVPTTELTT